MIDLTVITVTIPERSAMFGELAKAMNAQTVRPEWIFDTDPHGDGPVPYLNRLAGQVDTTWLFRLDDDDLIDPHHFEVLAGYLTDDYDIVYTWPRIDPQPASGDFSLDGLQLIRPLSSLRERNFIASALAIRRSLFWDLGGLRDVPEEDADLLARAHEAGARFRCVPEVTWTYRLGDWPHRSDREESDG